ncbi:type-F conjugative transfer system pilin assembly family protein [Orientia tsutsugamushi str. UT76]|uniref:Conjugal transfer protein TraN n=2 Tax=Orientia tsutsugamushi TaxID=784 RepID=A0A2U3QZV5_ORITS|nr:type-F conjugative transfer system pilin assembly family protein [Orientia tsutsugamushi str. UT76]SPR06469.1 conjugal transfer protein TraN [Orientia tsutsugamushi]
MLIVLLFVNNANAFFLDKQKTFIFVSFSMSDEALKSYFVKSQNAGAQLVMSGLINNSFIQTKNKTMELGISFDIDPSLFEQYKIDVVPVIVNDEDLTYHGRNQLGTESGAMLFQAKNSKNNALTQHNINDQNYMIANSMRIESDPLSALDSSNFVTQTSKTNTEIIQSCTEGSKFNIELIRELNVECRLENVWLPWQNLQIEFAKKEIVKNHSNWLKSRSDVYDESGAQIYCLVDDPEAIERQMKWAIVNRLGVPTQHIGRNFLLHEKNEICILEYDYRDKTQELREVAEYWKVLNPELEQLTESNECYEVNRINYESGDRVFFDKFKVNRPYWKQKIVFSCTSDPKDCCKHLKIQNCELKNSTCQKSVANICLLWQHDYSCSTEKQTMLHSSLRNNSIFCLGGNCNTPTIIPNRDIAKVAYLAMLNQMSKDIKTNPVSVFSGKHRKCKKDVFSFLNCCSSMTGWGRDIGLSQCKSKEQELALYRKKGYCYYIGTYCSSRISILGICLARKSTYCCFQSKLARIFQEEARKQLKMNFGTPKYPKCRGLTVEKLQKVDFTKINMDELFSDILTKAQNSMNKDIIAGIKDKVHRMQQSRH